MVVVIVEGVQGRSLFVRRRQLLTWCNVLLLLLLLGVHPRHWRLLLLLSGRSILPVTTGSRGSRRDKCRRLRAMVAIQGPRFGPLLLMCVYVLGHRHCTLHARSKHLL